ncbi:MAG: aminotransferase class V-fold PLP-dependent enzyme, partial [Chloroflexi bacterium]|nr:aminotransferase class V-fold PLP-dependent enzyme [Chloroflexota bacterium]
MNPTAFPSLKKFETEVVAMVASLLGGDERTVGNMTTSGTESLLMAVLTAREHTRATKPHIIAPEMVLPASAHPAFEKAAHYFGVKSIRAQPHADRFNADVVAMEKAITPNTILMVGSAPSYPQGVVDPIRELAQAALRHNVLFHTDACVGGMLLPFVRKLGYMLNWITFDLVALLLVSAIAMAWFYPLTRERHARIRALLERRRQRAAKPPVPQRFDTAIISRIISLRLIMNSRQPDSTPRYLGLKRTELLIVLGLGAVLCGVIVTAALLISRAAPTIT